MGYPMTYARLVRRNGLYGDYDGCANEHLGCIRGDMRRLELDTRDEQHLRMYADTAGITPEQVKAVFDKFFDDGCEPFKGS